MNFLIFAVIETQTRGFSQKATSEMSVYNFLCYASQAINLLNCNVIANNEFGNTLFLLLHGTGEDWLGRGGSHAVYGVQVHLQYFTDLTKGLCSLFLY